MTTEQWGIVLVYFAAPAATLFPILYWTTAKRWYRTWVGRAVMTSKVGLAVLVDNALLFHITGPTYPYQTILLTAFGVIGVGTWLYLFALIHEQIILRRKVRT